MCMLAPFVHVSRCIHMYIHVDQCMLMFGGRERACAGIYIENA